MKKSLGRAYVMRFDSKATIVPYLKEETRNIFTNTITHNTMNKLI